MSNVYRMNAIKKIAEAPASGFMPAATAYIGFTVKILSTQKQ